MIRIAVMLTASVAALLSQTTPADDAATRLVDPAFPGFGWPAKSASAETLLYLQPVLLQKAAAALKPRLPGRVNLYAVLFAGDGDERVFANEVEYLDQVLSRRFDAAGHVIVLENDKKQLEVEQPKYPIASFSNLEWALDALHRTMDPDNDILLVYLTSHGSRDHQLFVDLDPLPLDQIGADDLPRILDEHTFRWKVVVVSACYSGGFLPPLRGPGTLVMTAARSDRSSFGCGSDSDLTYFGRAFLVDALNQTNDLPRAFSLARAEVAAWEKSGKLEPSEPQIDLGADLAPYLDAWSAALPTAAPVAFLAPPKAKGRRRGGH